MVTAMEFCPGSLEHNFLIAGGSNSHVRCWKVDQTDKANYGSVLPATPGPVSDVCWSDVYIYIPVYYQYYEPV